MVLLTFHTLLVLLNLSRGCGVGVSESFKRHCLVGRGMAGHRWHLDLMSGHAGLGSECITEVGGIILPL